MHSAPSSMNGRSAPRQRTARAAGLAAGVLALLMTAAGSLRSEDDATGPERGPLRLVVFLVDAEGKPCWADALTCPAEVRVNRHTGTPHEIDYLRYSFTPHTIDATSHWTVSF